MSVKILSLLALVLLLTACSQKPMQKTKYIRLKGSDTMNIMTLRWAESYMLEHPDVSVYTEGGGSAQGFQALIEGEADICTSSRPMLPHEVRQLAEKHQRLGIAHLVAKDALSIYINPMNSITNLSLQQLKDIYTGKITNWKDIGGVDHPINVYTRSPNSGTFLYFKEHILDNEAYSEEAILKYSTQSIVDAILEDVNGIGYGGTAYGEKVTHCRIEGIAPTISNVIHDNYQLSRYLYLYTLDTPQGYIKDFIDWVMDQPGQVIVAKVGYIPLFRSESIEPQ